MECDRLIAFRGSLHVYPDIGSRAGQNMQHLVIPLTRWGEGGSTCINNEVVAMVRKLLRV